ncbi:MAG: glucose-6-phosphate dehydrogenase [Acidobacteria bacterium]|nr:glucose-6-phosphate dehydrogenase [Acidobacteriota bacterium]
MTERESIPDGDTLMAPAQNRPETMTTAGVDESVTIIIIGASGDLTRRKLMPSLYALYVQRLLHERFAIIGFARRAYDEASFRESMKEAIKSFSRLPVEEARLEEFIRCLYYHSGGLENPESYLKFKARIRDADRFPANRIFYLAITPEYFLTTIANLDRAELIHPVHEKSWSRVVIEKPFGRNYESARSLNHNILTHLDESQVYRIDHYLGKETAQNILSFRLANSIFEPVLNHRHVDHIQITAGETLGMEGRRGAYYDSAGALRDMVQNHLLQLLCLVAMEPPGNFTADALRGSRAQLLRSLMPPSPGEMPAKTVRAQYTAGFENGLSVPAYLKEDRIAPDSKMESYCALRLTIENWRWAGLPVYLRTGKRLKKRLTEIVIQFKQSPLQFFKTVECEGDFCDLTRSQPNTLVFRIQPDEGISLLFAAKRPSMQFVVENVAMNFSYRQTWHFSLPEAYERLLLDVMRGDSSLYTRSDQVEAAWQVMDPILKAWESQPNIPLHTYTPGSWGPAAADDLIRQDVRSWHNSD